MKETELKIVADSFYALGVPVLPVKIILAGKKYDKKFLAHSWKKWETQQQTIEEFTSLNWKEANAFAVVLGTKNNNGVHLSVIDYDCKGDITEDVKKKGIEILKEFPDTYKEQTVNKGQHLIYWSKTQSKTISTHHKETGIELLGSKKLCIITPSYGYSKLNENSITEVDNIEQIYVEAMKKHGLIKEQNKLTQNKTTTFDTPRICIKEALRYPLEGTNGHKMRLAIAAEYKKHNYSTEEIINLFKNQPDFDYDTCKVQVESADSEKTFTCKTIQHLGYCQTNCKYNTRTPQKDNKNKYQDEQEKVCIFRPTVVTEAFIAEMIWDRVGPPKYLKYTFNEDKFEYVNEISLGQRDAEGREIEYKPPFNDSVKKGLVIVPTGYTETTFSEVFKEVDAFAELSYDACGQDALVKLLTRIAVGSWFLDRFTSDPLLDIAGSGKFAPLIPIRGPSQSGKNRLAFVLRMLSYRPYFEMSTYRIPSLYRPLDLWQGTLILDEADFAQTNEKSELIHYLNCRATGSPVSRQNSKDPSVTDTFSNFGLTILTQRRCFDDNATESRAIPFYSEASTNKKLAVIETNEMLQMGLELQNKLLYLRMKHYKQIEITKGVGVDAVDGLRDQRLVASLLPLLAIAKFEPALKDTIACTVRAVERAKVEEKSNSIDGQLINYLWEKIKDGLFVRHDSGFYYVLENIEVTWVAECEEKNKIALTTSILANYFKWSSTTIRKALNSLGIAPKSLNSTIKVGKKTQRVIFFELSRLEKRLREFVFDYQDGSLVTLVAQVTPSICGGTPQQNLTDYTETLALSVKTETTPYSQEVNNEEKRIIVEHIPPAEPCHSCTNFAVESIITLPAKEKLRFCPTCCNKLEKRFSDVPIIYKQ